jgi:NAD(P)-dependent dehydrogenase (short-subunit alcohol dehydrogenase family)
MEGGRSNLTYVVSDGTGKIVVRRPLPHIAAAWNPAARDAFAATLALHRCAGPHEIVGAAMFLAGEQASYCTGAVVCLDGGLP